MNTLVTTFGVVLGVTGILMPGAANAKDSASTRFTITGDARSVCRLSTPSSSNTNNVTFDGSKIVIGQLLDEETATVRPSEVTITFPGVMCNHNAYLVVSSTNGGMKRISGTDVAVAESAAFLDRIDYKVDVTWGSVKISNFDTATLPPDKRIVTPSGGANASDLFMKISTEKGTVPVLMGSYTDNIDINLGYKY